MNFFVVFLVFSCAYQLRLVGATTSRPTPEAVTVQLQSGNIGSIGGKNLILKDSAPVLCQNSKDVLPLANLTQDTGNVTCFADSVICISNWFQACWRKLLYNIDVLRCATRYQNDYNEAIACALPTMMKYCDTSGCSTCQSSISTTFDNDCTSGGGQLCRQTFVMFNNQIQLQSLCPPSVCSSKLLSSSLAEHYAKLITTGRAQQNGGSLRKGVNDVLVTCGSGNKSYTAHGSENNTPVSPSHASSQTARFLSLVVAVFSASAVLRLF